jgi:pyruvate kinase
MPKTKIICTIGPASDSEAVLRHLMHAGMNVCRLNFSHGSHREHKQRIGLVRKLNKECKKQVKILQDLEGYRIRIGKLGAQKEIRLKRRQMIFLSNKAGGASGNVIPFDYEGNLRDIKSGSHIYIDDGNIALLVKSCRKSRLKTEVIVPGVLKENKGVNIPGVELKFKGLTDKDRADIHFGIREGVDYIAQSFVRDRHDIMHVSRLVRDRLPSCKIIAKIENRQGINNIDEIIRVSDGIMIARGDMGVSIPIYEIPMVQKEIIRKCNRAKKFVITATQMLESMTENIRPTRAEVTDVANAIIDGSDFLMLSAETAAGRHPAEAVRMMNEIIVFTERSIRKK